MKILFLVFSYCLFADPSLESYFQVLEKLGQPNGDYRKGEIEIVVTPSEISKIEEIQKNRLLKKGYSAADAAQFSKVGIISEDSYWMWIRDAVYFPKKIPGTYNRLIWNPPTLATFPGVAVLPILPSNRIALNLNFRHATRSWELELPRGRQSKGESIEQAALRELKEETGLEATTLVFLGEMAPDSGVLRGVVPVFLGRIAKQGAAHQDDSEAIAGILAFTKEELKQGFVAGFLEVPLNGKKEKVPMRDAFLAFALLQAEIRKLI